MKKQTREGDGVRGWGTGGDRGELQKKSNANMERKTHGHLYNEYLEKYNKLPVDNYKKQSSQICILPLQQGAYLDIHINYY